MSYRVELPVFSGPMDLLLHLVKQQEVDIHDIMISTVLEQYLRHVDVLESLDLADLGDFVVMASTLMEIKSKELLPREEVDLEQELSPKDDLIRRLLEYKRYRDISRRLAGMMQRRGQMVEPVIAVPKDLLNGTAEKEFDLGSIQVWDLTEAFAKLLEETGVDKEMKFDVSRRNVDYYAAQILDRIRGRGDVNFADLFDVSKGRYEVIGVFSVMLEMMKQGFLRGHQDEATREIRISYVGPENATVDEILRGVDDADLDDADPDDADPDAAPEVESGGSGTA
jgi:segregation and condensation protein A